MKLVNNTGLTTEQNLCYVNTAVQLLNNIPRLQTFFKKKEYRLQSESRKVMNISDELARLFNAAGETTFKIRSEQVKYRETEQEI